MSPAAGTLRIWAPRHCSVADHPLARAESRERTLRAQFAVTVVFGLLAGRALARARPARAAPLDRRGRRGRAARRRRADRARAPARARVRADRERSRGAAAARPSRTSARACAIAATAAGSRARSTSSRCSPTRASGGRRSTPTTRPCAPRMPSSLEIARLLRELPSVRARGVALVTRLVRDGATSPLYQGPAPAPARGARPHPARARPSLTVQPRNGAASGPEPRLAGCPRRSRSLPAAPTACASWRPSSACSASRPRCSCAAASTDAAAARAFLEQRRAAARPARAGRHGRGLRR